jgi:hypothetical protein
MTLSRHASRLAVLAAAGSGLLLGVQACGSGAPGPRPAAQTTTQLADASWAEHYSDLGSLKKQSDVAVLGTVTGVVGQSVVRGVPFTDYRITITRTLHDPRGRLASASSIVVHQTGGPVAPGRVVAVEDDPLFLRGETVALFLREYAPGHFRVLGGPAGRYELSRGAIVPANRGTVPIAANRTIDQFAGDVAKA